MTKRRSFAVIDAESDPFKRGRKPEPFIWGFYDGSTYEQFTDLSLLPKRLHGISCDIDEFIPFLFDRRIIVYAHNGGKFDYHFLLPYINDFEPILIINGRLAKFQIGDCEFRDSWNILPVPLAAYQKQKFDYSILEKDKRYKPHNWKRITDYLYSDCLYLYRMVEAFIDRHGVQLTQAGASMKSFRKSCKAKGILLPDNSNADFYEKFKPFYYGGRTEVFRKGIIKRPFKVVDINSAYPRAMLEDHATGVDYEILEIGVEQFLVDLNRKKKAAKGKPAYTYEQCLFHIKAISKGALPYRDKDGSLFFPNDNCSRIYFVTGWEVLAGVETGTLEIKQWLACYVFDETINFTHHIMPLWEHRKAAKEADDKENSILDKLEMNSLYGKFAANPQSYKEYMPLDPKHAGLLDHLEAIKRGHLLQDYSEDLDVLEEFDGYKFAGMLGPWVLAARDLPEDKHHYYNVVTAASITGYVRAKLWRNICKCKGVLYCDTDSIAATNVKGVTLGKELGQWDIEGNFSEGAIAGKKMYAFKYSKSDYKKQLQKKKKGNKIQVYKIASKGVKFRAWQIYALCRGQTIEYDPKVPTYSIGKEPEQVKRHVVMNAKTAEDMRRKV